MIAPALICSYVGHCLSISSSSFLLLVNMAVFWRLACGLGYSLALTTDWS